MMNAGKSVETVKQTIIHYVRKAVRELQKEYVTNRDVIPSSELTNSLCYGLEAVFLHGLVGSLPDKMASISFWSILSKYIHKSSLSDIDSLSQIKTDIGRCRVWIRLALNGCEFDSYLRLILADKDTLRQFYESWAFICDHECMDLLLTSIQGLECVNFHLGHNSTVLNEWSSTSLSLVCGNLVKGVGTNNAELDLSGTSSFDDYELSPDDREEVRLMFRFENIQNSGSDHHSEAANNESAETKSESHNCQESKETSSLNKEDIGDMKLSQNATTSIQGVGGDSHRNAKSQTMPPKIRMTDEMRDCRFERIVRGNLERYPLDYDRNHQQKLTEAAKVKTQSHHQNCKTETTRKHSKTPPIPSNGEFTNDEISGGEPDEFWKTLNEDDWNGTEAGSAGGTPPPVQGNSLPRDSWIGPPPSTHDGPTGGFSAEANDRVSNELEASYGTILADYQKVMPQQFKMVTQEGTISLFNEPTDGDGGSAKNTNKSLKYSTKRVSENQTLSVVDEEWVVIEDDCPFISEPYHIDSSCEQLSYVTQRFVKRTTGDQNQKCHGCSKEIEGKSRVCRFDGHSYCTQCHRNDLFLVPSQIIFNWDFQKYKVAVESFHFLKKIYDWPLVNIQELNPELYNTSVELSLTRELRQQSYHLAGYMFHCTSTYAAKYWRAMNARLYYFSHTDNYSLQDLVNVDSGSFRKVLKKINDSTIEHVYECDCCRAKGFYCEICQSTDIIFPFQIKSTTVCDSCKNTYHKKCKSSREIACPKCIRLELRKTTSSDPIDRVMFTHPTDILSTKLSTNL